MKLVDYTEILWGHRISVKWLELKNFAGKGVKSFTEIFEDVEIGHENSETFLEQMDLDLYSCPL